MIRRDSIYWVAGVALVLVPGSAFATPQEVSIFGVFFPPILLASTVGVTLASLTARVLNRYRLSRFLVFPSVMFLAITVIWTGLVGALWIPF